MPPAPWRISGSPQLAYNKAEHYAAEQRATRPGIDYNFFYYPPVFLLLCAALARLPYLVAFVVFEAASLALYLLVARRILDERGRQILWPLLAFPPVLWTIGLGQNSFLTAALLGAATLLVDRRPIIAGLLFGALCYKPHFALLVPVALVAGRCWRALGAAFASAASLSVASLALFGWQTWHDFLLAAATSGNVYATGRIPFGGFVTPFGAAMLLGATPAAAGVLQAAASAAAAGFVAFVWRRNLPLPIRAASLISATLVAVPMALFYDLVLAGMAGAWLLRADGKYRLPEWGKLVLAGLYILCLNPRGFRSRLASADRTARRRGARRTGRQTRNARTRRRQQPQRAPSKHSPGVAPRGARYILANGALSRCCRFELACSRDRCEPDNSV